MREEDEQMGSGKAGEGREGRTEEQRIPAGHDPANEPENANQSHDAALEIVHLRSNAAIPFPGLCWIRPRPRRAGGKRCASLPTPTPTHSPRKCPPRVRRCNRAMRPTLQPSVHYRIRRVRRDPEYCVPSSPRDPPRGVTHPATRTYTTLLPRSLANRRATWPLSALPGGSLYLKRHMHAVSVLFLQLNPKLLRFLVYKFSLLTVVHSLSGSHLWRFHELNVKRTCILRVSTRKTFQNEIYENYFVFSTVFLQFYNSKLFVDI